MCKFVDVDFNTPHNLFSILHHIPNIQACYCKYFKYLQDDFAKYNEDILSYIKHCSPYFWIVLDYDNQFMGFIAMDNFVGSQNYLYSGEIAVCLEKKAWGSFTRCGAKIFLKKCFDELGLYKIKAQIFPDNFRVKTILKTSGFEYESTLKAETLRDGKPQDIEVYSLYRTYSDK